MVMAPTTSPTPPAAPSTGRRWLHALSVALRGLYLWLVQAAVGLVWLLLVVYLAINSPSASGLLTQVLSDALPGALKIQSLQWGPSPGNFVLRGVAIEAPDGTRVIGIDEARIRLQIVRLLTGLQAGKLDLRIDELQLWRPMVRMDEDEKGRLRLPLAFSDPDEPPSTEPGMAVKLSVGGIAVRDATYDMQMPAITIHGEGLQFDGDVRVETRGDDPPAIDYHATHVFASHAEAKVAAVAQLPPLPSGTLHAAAIDGSLDGVKVRDLRMWLGPQPGIDLELPHSVLSHADLTVELGDEVRVRAERIQLAASNRLPFLSQLLGPIFDADAHLDGGFSVDPQRGFQARAKILGRGLMAGFQSDRVAADVTVEAGPPGEAAVRVTARDLEVDAFGGRMTSPVVHYFMAMADGAHHVRAQWALEQIRASLALTSQAVAMTGDMPALLDGAMTGTLGTVVRAFVRPDGVELDVGLDMDLNLQRKGFMTPATDAAPYLTVRGGVGLSMGPDKPLVVQLDKARIQAGTARAIADGRGSTIEADGLVHLGGPGSEAFGNSRLRVSADVPRLQDLLLPLGIADVSGSLRFDQGEVRGSLLAPGALGRLRLDNVKAYGHTLHRMEARLALNRGRLQFKDLVVDSDLGRIRGDVALQVFGKTVSDPAPSQRLEVRNLALSQVDLAKVLPQFGINGISGSLTLGGARVDADLGRLLPSLRFSGRVAVSGLQAGGEAFPTASLHLELANRKISVSELDVELEAGPHLTGQGSFNLRTQAVEAMVDLPLVTMTSFRNVAKLDLPLRGKLGAHVEVSGDLKQLGIQSRLLLRGLAWEEIVLGDADIDFVKAPDGQAKFASANFFPRFLLLEGSGAQFAGAVPLDAVIKIGTDGDIDPFAVLGMARPAGMRVKIRSEVTTLLDFRPGAVPFRVEATLPKEGLFLDVGGGLPPLRNATATRVLVDPTGVTIDATVFDFYRERLEVCGSYKFGDATLGTSASMLVFLSGALDIPRIGPLTETLAFLDLRLDILADPVVAADKRSRCLTEAKAGAGRLRIEGPLDDLTIQGLLQTRQSRVAIRRFGHEIQFAPGGRFQVTSGRDGALTLSIPREFRLSGSMDDGKFAIWGSARATGSELETADFFLQGTDIPFSAPKEYSVLMGPDLRFIGTNLRQPSRREMKLTGTVYVNEGAFVRSFDNLGNLVGNAGDRRVDSYSKPITETMPWINELGLELQVRGNNFEVASRVPFGKTDLVTEFDMDITGNLAGLHITGRAKVMDGSGSQISTSFNNLQFEVDHGWLDFNGDPTRPYLDLGLKAEIPVRANQQASSAATNLGADLVTDGTGQDEIVVVFVKISGVYSPDSNTFDIELSSNKGDKEADVQCLIVSRRRCTDTSSGTSPRLTTDFLFGEFASSLTKGLLKDLVDTVSIDFDPASLGVHAEVTKKLGKSISLGTRVQTGRENRYNATFSFRITDRLSLNGLWRRQRLSDTTGTSETSVDVYESKLRYKVPIED